MFYTETFFNKINFSPMGKIERYFGVEESKKVSKSKLNHRSKRYLAKLKETQILIEVNRLYSKGNTAQCFSLLEQAAKLVPNDFSPYYILALIHEENQNYKKAVIAYTAAAILKKNDVSLWKKSFEMAALTKNSQTQVLSIERIYRKEPSEGLLAKKMEILKRMKKKYSTIACQIEMFDYKEIDFKIFEKFEKTRHINSLKKVCSRLYKCIRKNKDAQCIYFITKTIENLYKISDFKCILCLLDEFYFKNGFELTPEIRLIYFIATNKIEEYRYDPLLEFKALMDDENIWMGLRNEEYAYDIANFFKSNNDFDRYFKVLENLLKFKRSHRVMNLLAEYYFEQAFKPDFKSLVEHAEESDSYLQDENKSLLQSQSKEPDLASNIPLSTLPTNINVLSESAKRNLHYSLNLYHQILVEDPVNDDVKTKIYRIYNEIGNEEMAKKFETTSKVNKYIMSIESSSKQAFRYPEERCDFIRRSFEYAMECLEHDPIDFIERSFNLLEDFFQNPFIILKNKNFKSFSNKHEKIVSNSTILFNEEAITRSKAEKFIRISSLHGLDSHEWFLIVKHCIFAHIYNGDFNKAFDLVEKSYDVEIFKHPAEYMVKILFLGLRICLMTKNLSKIVDITRRMINIYDFTAVNLLYAISHLFPNYYLNKNFSNLCKYIQRMTRIYSTSNSYDSDEKYSEEEYRCFNKFYSVTEFMGLSSYLPRFLQTDTVDFINEYKKEDTDKTNLLAGIINIAHTKCRTLIEKKLYATKGINYVKSMPTNDCCKMYNMAKAYHFYGYYEHAEQYYLKVINEGKGEIRRMAIFNLSLIFKKNKSKKIIMALISKFYDK